jgi:hypothetical protein
MSLEISKGALSKFQQIKQIFISKTQVPEESNWNRRSNNDIWLEMVAQIVVVGRSEPWDRLKANIELKNRIGWENLRQIPSQEELRTVINQVLLAVGTRYASRDVAKSLKAKALAFNLNVLKEFKDGPRGFLTRLSEFQRTDRDKIEYAMHTLVYIKSKGARDLLMELGLVRNAIALDVRAQTILQKLGIQVPEGFQSNSRLYDEVERHILTKVCVPLGIQGIVLDRMLYQNYEAILRM